MLPHMNCANMDCNELFIACPPCKSKWNGCCCESCTTAPRLLRPAKLEGGRRAALRLLATLAAQGRQLAC
jgi:predicted sulfurtransferase